MFALAALVDTCVDWRLGAHRSGWAVLGWLGDAVAGAAIVLALGVVVTVAARPVAAQVSTAVWATWVGLAAAVVVVVEVLEADDRCPGSWIGLVLYLALATACWLSVADERTDAPGSAYAPPPERRIPPA